MLSTLSALPYLPLAEVQSEGIGWYIFFYVGLVMATIFIFFTIAKFGVTKRVFQGLPAQSVEHMILFIDSIAIGVIGPSGRKYVPFFVALWSFIFVSNVLGLVFSYTPTAEWSLNISLAVITMVYVQWEGIRANGLFGHVKHFAGPKMFGVMILVSVMLFFIEIVSEAMKLFSLSIRLFGNIHGGHKVVDALNNVVQLPIGAHTVGLPLGGLLLPIKLLTAVLQAYVFVILSATYIALVTSHEHDDDHKEHDSHVASATPADVPA
jgi:F-type H+-transporting ATPase subunit a